MFTKRQNILTMYLSAKCCLIISLFPLVELFEVIEGPSNLTGLSRRKRIIGGTLANKNDYRFMVFLFWVAADDTGMSCCGTLFTRRMVITAANCVQGRPSNVDIYVDMGSDKYTMNPINYDGDGVRILASKTIIHPKFKFSNSLKSALYDIAIVVLNSPATLGETISLVKLTKKKFEPGTHCVVAGWGASNLVDINTAKQSKIYSQDRLLYEIKVKIVDRKPCEKIFGEGMTNNLLCAKISDHGYLAGPTYGDAGGPMMCGGIQYGFFAAMDFEQVKEDKAYALFVRIYNFLDWLNTQDFESKDVRSASQKINACMLLYVLCVFIVFVNIK